MNEIIIEKLDHQGRGISHISDKIVFVENALPGEKVEIKITRENKKILEAVVTKYLVKSPERVESKCPYYAQCGGCDLLHLKYENQLKYKENKIKEIIIKYAGLNSDIVKKIVESPRQYNYRNKITLKSKGKLGYYKRKSYEIIDIEKCQLANKKINDSLSELRKETLPSSVNEIVIRSINEEEVSLTIYLQYEEKITDFIKKIEYLFNSINVVLNKKAVLETGKSNIIGRLSNFEYQMSQTAFFQVNTLQTVNLYNKIAEYIKKLNFPTVLDLYCGTGTIGIYVSDFASNIIGIEINAEAIEDAKANANINKINNIEFFAGDVKKILVENNYKANLIIIDPPRSGLEIEVIEEIVKVNPSDIIYVSCDPITLSRDLKSLSDNYIVEEITPFDMFPNTYHVECVVKLVRK